MQHFTPVPALVGGALSGPSAVMLMLFLGRVAGVSGIVGRLFGGDQGDVGWLPLLAV